MSKTSQFNLPLIQAAQAQKHVTVNEALSKLDAMAQMRLSSVTIKSPPNDPKQGVAYWVPSGAIGRWENSIGMIAIYSNGGWVFIVPKIGWRAWVADANERYIFFAGLWRPEQVSISSFGAETQSRIFEIEHVITKGNTNTTTSVIPNSASVIGVTARVVEDIVTDGATSWKIGVPGYSARYGATFGLLLNSYAIGLTGSPLTYWGGAKLLLEPETGKFISGKIRLCVHAYLLSSADCV